MDAWSAEWAARMEQVEGDEAILEVAREMGRDRSRPVNPLANAFILSGGIVVGWIMIRQARRRGETALKPTPEFRARERRALHPSQRYETFGPRLGAGFLEAFSLAPVSALISQIQFPGESPWRLIFEAGVGLFYSAFAAAMLTMRGQTAGKWLCRVQVRDVGEGPLRPWQAMIREGAHLLFTIGVLPFLLIRQAAGTLTPEAELMISSPLLIWALLEIITMLSNKKRRALHDYLARSVVVRVAD